MDAQYEAIRDHIRKYIDKKSWYEIPYWDRVRLVTEWPRFWWSWPQYRSTNIPLNCILTAKGHLLLSQIFFEKGNYAKYELELVTYRGRNGEARYERKKSKLLVEVWFRQHTNSLEYYSVDTVGAFLRDIFNRQMEGRKSTNARKRIDRAAS